MASRNRREGHYMGWSKGHHIRDWEATKVDSWRAFRLLTIRVGGRWTKVRRNK